MAQFDDFIPENIAPSGVRMIGIYNSLGNPIGKIPLGHLSFPDVGKKLYSFGALSDVHVTYTTGEADFKNALSYLNNEVGVNFICISGDLASTGSDEELSLYKEIVEEYSPNTPIYVSAGNHDAYDVNSILREPSEVSASMSAYTGKPLYYSVEYGDDIFIFVGYCKGAFSQEELQWLYETLEANRNRRCFLFQHMFALDGCGDVFGL